MLRVLALIWNGICAVLSLLLVIAAIVFAVKYKDVLLFGAIGSLKAATILLIIVGILMFIFTILGTLGAMLGNLTLLNMFVVGMTVLFVLVIAGYGTSVNVLGVTTPDSMESQLGSKMETFGQHKTETDLWNGIQEKFECCGIKDKDDWGRRNKAYKDIYPDSCCEVKKEGCGEKKGEPMRPRGCLDKVIEFTAGRWFSPFFSFILVLFAIIGSDLSTVFLAQKIAVRNAKKY